MLRVCVVFGGANSEHEVSLRSAECVLNNIDRAKYEVVLLGITKQGKWLHYTGPEELIAKGLWQSSGFVQQAIISPDAQNYGVLLLEGELPPSVKLRRRLAGFQGELARPMIDADPRVIPIDVVIPVLHGKNGEDGTIQGLFELAGIPYVGSGVLASAMCMDKEMTHYILTSAGINKTDLVTIHHYECNDMIAVAEKVELTLKYPMFVKPANAGSSVGVSKAKTREDLIEGIYKALKHDTKAVIERTMVGREIECAVMGNENPIAAYPLGEIIPMREFYDYDGKYEDDSAGLAAPADIDFDSAKAIREMAVKAYKAMGCRGLSRVDFFLEVDGTPVLNEINTFPGFTSISMFPRLFQLDGIDTTTLINRLIDYALEK